MKKLKSAYEEALHESFDVRKLFFENYHKFPVVSQFDLIKSTGITKEILKEIGWRITNVPSEFEMHPQIRKIFDARK